MNITQIQIDKWSSVLDRLNFHDNIEKNDLSNFCENNYINNNYDLAIALKILSKINLDDKTIEFTDNIIDGTIKNYSVHYNNSGKVLGLEYINEAYHKIIESITNDINNNLKSYNTIVINKLIDAYDNDNYQYEIKIKTNILYK